jgi:hypothetical protein
MPLGDEDAAHGAAAQLALEPVAVGQSGPEAINCVGQAFTANRMTSGCTSRSKSR